MELVNNVTKRWIDAFLEHPKSTLLIECGGDSRSGDDIANQICMELSSSSHIPIVRIGLGDKKSIGIDDVRELQKSMQLKANSDGEYTRFVIIQDAEKLTVEAQNSLLKLIEELPNKTILIIVSNDTESLLETVKSRCFHLPVLPISEVQAIEYGEYNGHDQNKVTKAYLLSGGYPTKFIDLLNTDDPLYELVDISKKFIGDSIFERQIFLQSLASPKSTYSYSDFSHALKLTAKSGMRFAGNSTTKNHWKNILQAVIRADSQVDRNVSEKLALLSLSVSI